MRETDRLLQHGLKLHAAGKLAEAEAAYRRILALQPDHSEALHLLGVIAHQAGQSATAVDLIGRAIAVKPDVAAYHLNRAAALGSLNRLDEALVSLSRALELKSDFPEALANLSDVLLRRNLPEAAVEAGQRALALKPDYAEAANNLGNALLALRKTDEAIAAFSRAIILRPNFALAHFNLANALRFRGNFGPAIDEYHRAIGLSPNEPHSHNNLGRALIDTGNFEQALASFQRAVVLAPNFAEARSNLANTLKMLGFLDEAIAEYQAALSIAPGNSVIRSSFIYMLFCSPRYDAAAIFAEQRKWYEIHAKPLAIQIRPHGKDPNPDRRLRIGYVSADFRDHVAGLTLIPLLQQHDSTNFELICYSNAAHEDSITQKYRAAVNGWRDITAMDDDAVAQLIREDRIDILMDLSLHSEGNRLPLFARKPAPVQGAFIGYPGSTGLDVMDFRVTDPYLDPPDESDQFYSEESIRLPACFWCFDPEAMQVPRDPITPLPALANGFITFGAMNNICKVTPQVMELWSRVLRAAEKSKLLLLVPPGLARRRVTEKFQSEKIDLARIEFIGRLPRREYHKTYERIDLCLDTFPCNGHATTLDSLWMGVPVVTMVCQTVAGRAGWSQLCNLNLRELAAFDADEFVKIASALSNDLSQLSELRQSLRQRMLDSPICDARRFAGNVETIYREMWRKWCTKHKVPQ